MDTLPVIVKANYDKTKRVKTEKELPPLCVAVKRVRERYGDSQERFAQRLGVSVVSVSRFERGSGEPSDPRILRNLSKVAYERGDLPNEYALFMSHIRDYIRAKGTEEEFASLEKQMPNARFGGPATEQSMPDWRLSFAVRLSRDYFPESISAIESAVAPALSVIDEVLCATDEAGIDYGRIEVDVLALARQQALQKLKQTRKDK